MALLVDEAGEIPDEAAITLLERFEQLGANLAAALASGEGLDAAQAQYDAFMQFLIAFAEQHGLVVDDLLADWDRIRDEAAQPLSSGGGTSFGTGAPQSTDLSAALSELAGFGTSLDDLTRIIEHLAGGNLETTLADDTLQYLSDIFEDAPQGLIDHVLAGLDEQLLGLGLSPDDQLAALNAELRALGLREVTPEQWAEWNRSEVDAIDGLGATLTRHWTQQTDRLLSAMGASTAGGGAIGSISGATLPGGGAPQRVGPETVVIPVSIGNEQFDTYIVETVTGSVRRELR
jgi:hypothetical protein